MSKITIIESNQSRLFPDFGELWRYRQLLFSLAWRDIRVKYAQTFIGILWSFLNPILNLVILSFIFGTVMNADTNEIPPVLFTVAGLSTWNYFSTLLSEAGNSLIGAQNMISKVYFPRLIIPLSKALSGMVDYVITIICLIVIMIYYGYSPGMNIIWLPLFVGVSIIAGLAGGILISALNIRYRDFKFITPVITRIGLYVTPIAYSSSMIPDKFAFLYSLNPMVGVVEGFRWSLLGEAEMNFNFWPAVVSISILFVLSLVIFNKVDRNVSDLI